jgi:uncharacterized protein (DUF302 family)
LAASTPQKEFCDEKINGERIRSRVYRSMRSRSKYSVPETMDRLEKIAKSKGLTIFARIDHSGEAEKAGLKMRPTQLLILGNPKAGTPLMNASPSIAIDLPLKALAWQDADGKVWLGYNNPDFLKQRHNLPDDMVKVLGAIGGLVDAAVE